MPEIHPPAGHVVLVAPRGPEAAELRRRIAGRDLPVSWQPALADPSGPPGLDLVAMVVAGEVLDARASGVLEQWLALQEPTSDLPILLVAAEDVAARDDVRRLVAGFNVTVVPRPVPGITLETWLGSAARARRSQQHAAARLHELEQAHRLGRALVTVLGHDLRTPLASAQLSAEVILRASSDERARVPAARILSSAQRMHSIVDQLLDYVRLAGGGRIPLRRREADAGEVCRRVLGRLAEAAPDAQLLFDERGDPLGDWDPDRLAQLVASVVSAALQRGGAAGPVHVSLDGLAEDAIRVEVESAGGPLGASEQQALFEAFHGLLTSAPADSLPDYARPGEGLGLGLYLAREIARAHGGELVLDPCAQGRLRFLATLPRRAA